MRSQRCRYKGHFARCRSVGAPRPTAEPRDPVTSLPVDALNAETPLSAACAVLTPPGAFFVRNHFAPPAVAAASHRLRLDGLVRRPLTLGLEDLRALPGAAAEITLECAGNGRALLDPLPPGTPWRLGAFGTALWEGTPLAPLLRRAGPLASARWVVFTGADEGEVEPGRVEPFARALPLEDALGPGPLLAWRMNGAPLALDHGHPLRLVAPGRYGVDSVKWLVRIELVAGPFGGFFQARRYRYEGQAGTADGTPVTRIRPRALIGAPAAGERVRRGAVVDIAGIAWSGFGAIARVDVSADGGATWLAAALEPQSSPAAAVGWRLRWVPDAPGSRRIVARARDAAGNVQPLAGAWNRLGYGNNQAHQVDVEVGE